MTQFMFEALVKEAYEAAGEKPCSCKAMVMLFWGVPMNRPLYEE